MARAVSTDPFRCFRFAPKVGFDGRPMGVQHIKIMPGAPWAGAGEIVVMAMLGREIIDFAGLSTPDRLVVGVYHVTDDMDGEPSLHIVLENVTPANCSMSIASLDATADCFVTVTLRMQYDRLTFIFGDNPLDKIAAVV